MLNLNVIPDLQFMQLSVQREKPRHITNSSLKLEMFKIEALNSFSWVFFHLIKNGGN